MDLRMPGNTSSLAIFTHVEVKRRDNDEVAFYKRMKFAEIPRDLRLSQLIDTVLRVLKCSDYNSQRRTSCYLCLPSWKPQRLCDVVVDPHKANTGAVLGPIAHVATLYIAVINEELPPHNLEAIQSFIKFYIKLCRVDCQSLSSFVSQHNFPLTESDILSLISEKPQKPLHLTLADLTRCNEWCARIMQTHHAVTNYFMRPNAFISHHPLSFVPGEELKQESLPMTDWHPHSPSLNMKGFASAMAMHTGSGGGVLNQHTPLMAHPASHSPHDANDYFSSVLSQRLMTAPQQASTPTSAVNLTPSATVSIPSSNGIPNHHYTHPRTPVADEVAPNVGGTPNAEQRKKPQRMRTSFDADYELPYLMTRFKENPNPTKENMEEIKQILNNMPSRKTKRKLDLTNIMYWFKNMRAGFRKRERLSGTINSDRHDADGSVSGDNSHQRLDRMDAEEEEEDEDDEEELEDEEEEEKKRKVSEDERWQLPEDEETNVTRETNIGNEREEDNKENVMKCDDRMSLSMNSPPDDEEQDDDTEIIEGRPEDFRDEEEDVPSSRLTALSSSDLPLPEDLTTSRPHPSLGSLPPLRLPLPPLMSHRPHPGAWQQPIDGATAFAYLTQRVMARGQHGGQMDTQSATPSSVGGEIKMEVGLEVKHNSVGEDGDGGSNDSMLGGSARKRKRTRVFIDPTTEVPKLKEWFLVDTHPTAQMIELYTSRLNSGEYRNRQQPLEPKNVQLWFKNHRAKVKRRRLNETGQDMSATNPGFLPPLLSQPGPDSSPGHTPVSPLSSDEQPIVDPGCDMKDLPSSG